jgi:predicted nucleic acid-binding protein
VILADTSVWVDHLNRGDRTLERVLRADQVLMHPFVLGEVALGSLRNRSAALEILHDIPRVVCADDREVLRLIDDWELFGSGIGYTDAHLLAAVLLTPKAQLWTRDRRLRTVARQLALDAGLS